MAFLLEPEVITKMPESLQQLAEIRHFGDLIPKYFDISEEGALILRR